MTNTETNTDETLNENENEHETLGLDTTLEAVWRPSPNYQPRRDGRKPNILLLHYTAMEKPEWAIERLCDEETGVSCHYLVAEDGAITQMVSESKRAWHAGHSYWAGETDINSASIGIEIANPGHELGYPDFPEAQMQAVEALCKDILSRHDIPPSHVLGHSDVAPRRKKDPGEKFDWARLYRAGIGHWVEPEPIGDDIGLRQGDKGDEVRYLQKLLSDYGYLSGISGRYSKETVQVVTAFQRHFRPARVDGVADRSTIATLEKLLAALPAKQLA